MFPIRLARCARSMPVLGLGIGLGIGTKLLPPTNVAVTAFTDTTLSLSWTASVGATSYRVYTSTDGGMTWTFHQSVSGTSATLVNLTDNTSYTLGVSAKNSGGESAKATVFQQTATTLFLDNFVDLDGTELVSHTPDVGGAWSQPVTSGSIRITNDQAVLNALDGGASPEPDVRYLNDCGGFIYTLDCPVLIPSGLADHPSAGPMFRYNSSTNTFLLLAGNTGVGAVSLYYFDGTTFNLLQRAGSFGADAYHTLTAVCSGANVSCYIDGTFLYTDTSGTNSTQTGIGLACPDPTSTDTGVMWASLRVRTS